ncbi:MAG: DUF1328 domain-containing protein [Patescibacteria group bacterium]
MRSWSVTFLIIAIVAALLGFGVVAGTAATTAKLLLIVLLVLLVGWLVSGRGGPPSD